ncbi:MAG: pilus assembly protein [Comamonas sp.]
MPHQAIHHLLAWAACSLALAAATPALAQYTSDIDIYSGISASDPPNVLILLDNTANWNNAFTNEIAALKSTIQALPPDKFRVGLMLFTETGNPNSNEDGGYMRAAIRPLDANYKTKFVNLLDSLHVINDKSNGGKAGKTMAEAYYYFTGAAPNSGNRKAKTDYSGNTSGTTASNAIYQLSGNAIGSFAGSPYTSPVVAGCARNFIIYISNGAVQDNNSDNTDANNRLNVAYTATGLTRPETMISLTPNGSQTNVADEWAKFMKMSPSVITSFTLDVDRVTTGQGPGWSALLKSMAQQSGGEYYAVSSQGSELADKLLSTFFKIQAVDSVFASASLPISTNARGTYLNQVFMGMFRPAPDSKPRWRGNLKQYQFKYDVATDSLMLADANGNSAVGTTGFISPTAVSYWTAPSTFWANQQMGTPPSGSDSPDGYVVEKGGIAQSIRTANLTSQASRNVYTCVNCASETNLATSASTQFAASNAANLNALSANTTERDALIEWVRGRDNRGDEAGPGGTTTVRPTVHGDVLHSRPAVVNYGNGNVVVFYGANDGSLRAINGKQSGTGAGQELWSFLPQEHFGKLKRLRDNTPEIRISTTPVLTTDPTPPLLRDYFVDGPISVYQKLRSDQTTEKAILYMGMRRGGRFIYAIDITTPAEPKFLWKQAGSDSPSDDFYKLGQTWSDPRVTKLRGRDNPVLIMGGGYDATAEDAATPGTTTMGNAIFVLDAINGTLIKRFDTTRSVTADVAVVDSDKDGYTDRAYAADLAGNLYRIDLEKSLPANPATGAEATTSTAVADWGIYTLAALRSGGTRKFFYAPAVTTTPTFTAVQVGSGDREKPLQTTGTDAFFTVFDERMTKGTPDSFTAITTLGQVGTTESKANGCYIPFASGEKAVNAPAAFMGTTYFGTNKPTPPGNTCTANLGEARAYEAPMFCGAPASAVFAGGGLPPSPVVGYVQVPVERTGPDGQTITTYETKPFVTGGINSARSPISPKDPKATVKVPRKKRYWFQEKTR